MDDRSYFSRREAEARRAAKTAQDPAARAAHLRMASEYHRRAEAAATGQARHVGRSR